jgi:hypothetical protein
MPELDGITIEWLVVGRDYLNEPQLFGREDGLVSLARGHALTNKLNRLTNRNDGDHLHKFREHGTTKERVGL